MKTFEHIKIQGVEYQKVIDINIEHKIGEHGQAVLILEMKDNSLEKNRLVGKPFEIKCMENDEKETTIFYGVVTGDYQVETTDYTAVRIEAKSMSYLLDREPVTATYQNKFLSHQEIMESVCGNEADIHFGVTDTAIGKWLYRNNETSWQFIKRVASGCNACIFTNIDTKVPVIYIGRSDKECADVFRELETYIEGLDIRYRTYEKVELGMKLSETEYINYLKVYFLKGFLVYEYSTGDIDEFKQEVYYNQNSACKMLEGRVEEVDREKVQVFFDTIDESFDSSGDIWFEYATSYASKGGAYGSGFYCMPEKGDRVKVFMPAADEGSAFAFGSVSAGAIENPGNVKIANTFGKEILLTDKEIRITCNGTNMYISMQKDGEINVWSDKKISLKSDANISIYGQNSVHIYAPQRVEFNTVETTLVVDKEKIIMNGEKLQIN